MGVGRSAGWEDIGLYTFQVFAPKVDEDLPSLLGLVEDLNDHFLYQDLALTGGGTATVNKGLVSTVENARFLQVNATLTYRSINN